MRLIRNIGELFVPDVATAPVVNDVPLSSLRDAWLLIEDGTIEDFGTGSAPVSEGDAIDAQGGAVVPGLVDSHSHLVFAGTREDEFVLRSSGKSYLEIAKAEAASSAPWPRYAKRASTSWWIWRCRDSRACSRTV